MKGIPSMNSLDDVLNRLTSTDADPMIVRPATDKDIKLCNKDFAKCGFGVSLPAQYAEFLKLLNGFAWNGIEFFSTDQVTDPETNYTLNDIVSANEDFSVHNEGLRHCVLLGRADDDLYVYNTQNGRYEVLDMTGRDVIDEYETFEAMFVAVVAPRI
jgi:hypothetical protein